MMNLKMNLGLCVVLSIVLLGSSNSHGQFENSIFDPGTWNPGDWVRTPRPKLPLPQIPDEKLIVQNIGSETIYFSYDDGRTTQGWYAVEGGQTKTMTFDGSVLSLRVQMNSQPFNFAGSSKQSLLVHPNNAFELEFVGDKKYRAKSERLNGTYSEEALRRNGFTAEEFFRFDFQAGESRTFTINPLPPQKVVAKPPIELGKSNTNFQLSSTKPTASSGSGSMQLPANDWRGKTVKLVNNRGHEIHITSIQTVANGNYSLAGVLLVDNAAYNLSGIASSDMKTIDIKVTGDLFPARINISSNDSKEYAGTFKQGIFQLPVSFQMQ